MWFLCIDNLSLTLTPNIPASTPSAETVGMRHHTQLTAMSILLSNSKFLSSEEGLWMIEISGQRDMHSDSRRQ